MSVMWTSEEGIRIKTHGDHISKDLEVFYNPAMKINRDSTLLIIASCFKEPITACDPLVASGIRQLRILHTMPQKIRYWSCGDISKQAIEEFQENLQANGICGDCLEIERREAHQTMSQAMYDFIEIDPFGSPVPFLDLACQKIKNNGILSVTATDTAALCGTYPKKTLRRYGIKVEKMYWYEEAGLRNLIAYCQRQAAKYDKTLTPILSYVHNHFYKLFFRVHKGRQKALETLESHEYLAWDARTQELRRKVHEKEASVGKIYTGPLYDEEVLQDCIANLYLIGESREISKVLSALEKEPRTIIGYYNPHKLEKSFKFNPGIKFEDLLENLRKEGFQASRVHNNPYGIKTDADYRSFLRAMGYDDS